MWETLFGVVCAHLLQGCARNTRRRRATRKIPRGGRVGRFGVLFDVVPAWWRSAPFVPCVRRYTIHWYMIGDVPPCNAQGACNGLYHLTQKLFFFPKLLAQYIARKYPPEKNATHPGPNLRCHPRPSPPPASHLIQASSGPSKIRPSQHPSTEDSPSRPSSAALTARPIPHPVREVKEYVGEAVVVVVVVDDGAMPQQALLQL